MLSEFQLHSQIVRFQIVRSQIVRFQNFRYQIVRYQAHLLADSKLGIYRGSLFYPIKITLIHFTGGPYLTCTRGEYFHQKLKLFRDAPEFSKLFQNFNIRLYSFESH